MNRSQTLLGRVLAEAGATKGNPATTMAATAAADAVLIMRSSSLWLHARNGSLALQ